MKKLKRTSFTPTFVAQADGAERLVFGVLVGVALLLLVLGGAGVPLIERGANSLRDGVAPVMAVVTEPVQAARGAVSWVGEQFALAEENQALREQVDALLRWQSEATRLSVENASLRDVLKAHRSQPVPLTTTARIIADSRSPFVHTRLLDAGVRDGVAEGMAALSGTGLVGQVVDVEKRSSRLLLLTDLNSKIPVLVLPARDHAILAGTNGAFPRLEFLPLTPRFSVGDRVVTSGAGGLFPLGLSVGQVVDAGDGDLRVAPAVDWSRLDHLRLVQLPAADFAERDRQ